MIDTFCDRASAVLTMIYSLLQADQLKWLIDLCADMFAGHKRSDYIEYTFASQSAELVD